MFHWISKLNELKKSSESFCLATITNTRGSGPRKLGTRMIVIGDGSVFGTIGGGNLEHLVLKKAKSCMGEGENITCNFPLDEENGQECGGSVDVLFEVFGKNPRLFIFGSGHVGLAVSKILKDTLFDVHLIDEREEWISKVEHGSKHQVHWKEFIEKNNWNEQDSYAVAMSPSHAYDLDIASLMIQKSCKYFGVIGSKSKWASFKRKLKEQGISDGQIEKIKSPIGMVRAGSAPTEIAISLACELLDTYYNK